uniref:Connective tissue growth factor n=1 Tax=Ciona savignyi TaxID=51511 RepID=H2Z9W4_CIOSA
MTSFLINTLPLLFISIYLVQNVFALCPRVCDCQSEPRSCQVGVSLVTDGCNCCKVCARQVGDECNDQEKVCDPHRNLFCDYSGSRSGDLGVCRAQNGRPCMHDGTRISSGSMFQPSCKLRCWCMDGAEGCMPLCAHETQVPLAHLCPNARLQPVQGECCSRWVCDSPNIPDDVVYESDGGSDGDEIIDYQLAYVESLHRPFSLTVTGVLVLLVLLSITTRTIASSVARGRGHRRSGCRQQASMWSHCTKTCGLGVSTRVSNANTECKLKREVRLCEVRPCHQAQSLTPKYGKRCMKQKRAPHKEHIVYSGCRSVRTYKPRYCGLCKADDRCCTPKTTRTSTVRFECEDGRAFYKRVMVIKSCRCHRYC